VKSLCEFYCIRIANVHGAIVSSITVALSMPMAATHTSPSTAGRRARSSSTTSPTRTVITTRAPGRRSRELVGPTCFLMLQRAILNTRVANSHQRRRHVQHLHRPARQRAIDPRHGHLYAVLVGPHEPPRRGHGHDGEPLQRVEVARHELGYLQLPDSRHRGLLVVRVIVHHRIVN
jgi:hypothetical protein